MPSRVDFANALSKMKDNVVRLFVFDSPLQLLTSLVLAMAACVEAVRPDRSYLERKEERTGARLNFCLTTSMPRRRRIHIDGVPLHVVQCGHNRGACFFDDQDRHAYLAELIDPGPCPR